MRASDALDLRWTGVRGATAYEARLVEEASGRLVWSGSRLAFPGASIADIETLDVGIFVLSVSASSYDAKGELERGGDEARSRFSLTLGPAPATPTIVTPRMIYVH
jgi:hypothetical protein